MHTLAALPLSAITDAHLDCYETNLASHRHLDKRLIETDLRLQEWAPWARPRYATGWPTRSVTEKVNEGGILARNTVPYPPEWPASVAETESCVAELEIRPLAAIFAHYFHLALHREERVRQFGVITRHLARTRPHDPRRVRSLGLGAFETDLSRARWALKAALRM